ncbi:MAG: bifunctional phosphoribosyl-AMP cyclohydrolase/phosphoribosyl-ATP diphosphatase HisIE [Actinomycetota bacterium]
MEGLIPAIIQDYETREVLMLAYMNRQSVRRSIETGTTWFWSRSRKKLWNKGETSGNYQKIREIRYDCDGDALLFLVEQTGNACHTGNRSCFYRKIEGDGLKLKLNFGDGRQSVIDELFEVIGARIEGKSQRSYTYALHSKGLDEILKKVGEESIEVILAAKHQKKDDLINEISDLLYHLLVLMAEKKLVLEDIYRELESRRK